MLGLSISAAARRLAPVLFLSVLVALFVGCSSDDAPAPPPTPPSPTAPPAVAPPAQGVLRVQVTGLPAGQDAAVVITRPGFERALTESADVPVPAGEYTVIARSIADRAKGDGSGFSPTETSTTVTVPPSAGATVNVEYTRVSPRISARARVASAATGAALGALARDASGGATLTFPTATAESAAWKPGDLVVFGVTPKTPEGFYGRVVSSDGKTVVTESAPLQELIEEGVIDLSQSFTAADIAKITPLQPLAPNLRVCGSLASSLGVGSGATSVALKVGGQLCIAPAIDLQVGLNFLKPPSVYFRGRAGVTGSLFIEGTATIGIQKEIPILSVQLGTITIPVGPVPVVILPTLVISVGAGGEITAGVTAGLEYAMTPMGGFHYDGVKNRFTTFASETHSFGIKWPEPIATATLKGFAGPNIDILIYGVAGPYVGVEGYVALVVDLLKLPSWELHGGFALKAGVTTNRLFKIDFSATLLELDFLLATAADPPPIGAKVGSNAQYASTWNPALGPNDVIYVPTGNTVKAAPRTSGAPLWTYTGTGVMASVIRAADGNLYAADFTGGVYALTAGGAERWKRTFAGRARLASPNAGTVYVGTGNTLASVSPADGSTVWSLDVGGEIRGLSIAKDGTIYATTFDGLVAVTPAGAPKWGAPVSLGTVAANDSAIGPDGTVYVVFFDGPAKIAAVTPAGVVKWRAYATGSDQPSSPVVGPDGTIYVCGTFPEPSVAALAPTGATKWRVRHGEYCEGPPVVGADGVVYLATDASLRAYRASNGSQVWSQPMPGSGGSPTGSPLLLSNGNLAAVGSGGLWVFQAGATLATSGWPRAGGDGSSAGVGR